MTAQLKYVYRFDLDHKEVLVVSWKETDLDFDQYLDDLIEAVIADIRNKRYLFPADQCASKGTIDGIFQQQSEMALLSFAQRLLRIETAVQADINKLNREVQKGILVQALVDITTKSFF